MIVPKNINEEDQRLFSTGNDELDAILEEVYFSGIEDGYDYAQKEFAEKKSDDKSTATGVALAGASGGALLGNKAVNKRILKKAGSMVEEINSGAEEEIKNAQKKADEVAQKIRPSEINTRSGRKKIRTAQDRADAIKQEGKKAEAKTKEIRTEAEKFIKRTNKTSKVIAGAGLTAAGIVTAAGALKRKSKSNEKEK